MKQILLKRQELPYEIKEELKTLRTNIQFCGDEKRVILFTSCVSGEGKSTTTLEVASSIAELGKNVLLIDTDLRKSVLESKITGGEFGAGLTHYLAGQCAMDAAIYQTNTPGLYISPAGVVPPNPSELLAGERLGRMIDSARKTYDYVIVDCAPLGMVVDAAVVAPRCDGVVLLIQAGAIQYRFAQEVVDKLKNTQCPLLGIVLNKVDRKKDQYYGYGKYGKYYDKKYEEYYK